MLFKYWTGRCRAALAQGSLFHHSGNLGGVEAGRPHVVVVHLARHAAEVVERALVASEQRLHSLVSDELDEGCAALAERRDEHRRPILPAPNGREVGLHLAPQFGFEPDRWLRNGAQQLGCC